MKRYELVIRISVATRIIIPILAIAATIKILKSAWEAGTLFFSAFVGVFTVSLVMCFVGILIIRKKQQPPPFFEPASFKETRSP